MGIVPQDLKKALTVKVYEDFRKYWYSDGFGSRAAFVRSGNQIITIMSYITGAMGGKPQNLLPEDIYPLQLADKPNKKRRGNNAVDWETLPDRHKQAFIERGMFTEDGDPIPQNPHR